MTWQHWCSIIGTVILVGGLYLVLWAKKKEMKSMSNPVETNRTDRNVVWYNNIMTWEFSRHKQHYVLHNKINIIFLHIIQNFACFQLLYNHYYEGSAQIQGLSPLVHTFLFSTNLLAKTLKRESLETCSRYSQNNSITFSFFSLNL